MRKMGRREGKFFTLSFRSRVLGLSSLLLLFLGAVWLFFRYLRYPVGLHLFCGMICFLMFLVMTLFFFWTSAPVRPFLMLGLSVETVAISVLVALFLPWSFASSKPELYSRHMAYLRTRHISSTCLPTSLPKDVFEYELAYQAEQKDRPGFLIVEYRCVGKSISEYRKTARIMSVLNAMSLDELSAPELKAQDREKLAELFGVKAEELGDYTIQLELPEDIDKHPDARVYITSCSQDMENPTTEAILIDVANGWVCFIKMVSTV